MLNAYIYYKRVHAFSHFPSRLSSPQKLDRVLLSYGFNSYRLRVNKLELELEPFPRKKTELCRFPGFNIINIITS